MGATSTQEPQSPRKDFTGSIEFRPTMASDGSEMHLENTLDGGHMITPNWGIGYTQYFNLNTGPTASSGLAMDEGFLSSTYRNVWKNVRGDLGLDMQTRFYLPTDKSKADAGMVTAVRHYFNLSKKISDRFSLIASYIPILHGYSRPGVYKDGKEKANPFFENRLYLTFAFTFSDTVSLEIPLMFMATRNRDFGNAAHWGFVVTAWPELTYKVADNTSLGLAFQGENFLEGIKGMPQAVFHQDL